VAAAAFVEYASVLPAARLKEAASTLRITMPFNDDELGRAEM